MGTLYVVATPIGNLEDITIRAIKILLTAPVIACEDTRHTGQLIKILEEKYRQMSNGQCSMVNEQGSGFKIQGSRRYISVRDWNEAKMVDTVIAELQNNDIALVSDAGTPLVSDPGFKIVRAARNSGFTVVPIPGVSAAITALSAAGLPTNKFMFWGFLPKKWELLPEMTHIIYEAPIRLEKTLKQIKTRYPQAEIVIANELTKIHEKLMTYQIGSTEQTKLKGEVTVLVYVPASQTARGEQVATGHGQRNGNI